MTIGDIEIRSDGNVTAHMNAYFFESNCRANMRNYPSEDHSCCFYVSPYKQDYVELQIGNKYGDIHPAVSTGIWKVFQFTTEVEEVDSNEKYQRAKICFKARVESKTMKLELELPVAVCAIVILIAPLFGNMKKQLVVKLFALLLQFLCFHYLADLTPSAGFGGRTPKICRSMYTQF